eukprot:31017-Pelagococcus_subviridis.AAC.15
MPGAATSAADDRVDAAPRIGAGWADFGGGVRPATPRPFPGSSFRWTPRFGVGGVATAPVAAAGAGATSTASAPDISAIARTASSGPRARISAFRRRSLCRGRCARTDRNQSGGTANRSDGVFAQAPGLSS